MSVLEYMRSAGAVMKATASGLIFSFLFVFYSPSAMAVNEAVQQDLNTERYRTGDTVQYQMSQRLKSLQALVVPQAAPAATGAALLQAQSMAAEPALPGPVEMQEILRLRDEIGVLKDEMVDEFMQVKAYIKEHRLPAVALQRNQAALSSFKKETNRLLRNIERLETAANPKQQARAYAAIQAQLQTARFTRRHQALDPNKLPFRTPNADVRKPFKRVQDLQALVKDVLPAVQVASTDPLAGLLEGPPAYAAPSPEDLAQNTEIQITPEIQALADSLGNQAAAIYDWVRDNIQFVPTYGSIQGANMTLQTRNGNAFDTASLLIALLRASGIPARYAYGTIAVPPETLLNWVGGVDTVPAAQNLIGQGGIPNVAIVFDNVITEVEMEHAWVEAYVDYVPSRGERNLEGDRWISMDASFKQYSYTPEMDFRAGAPLDVNALVQDINANALIDEVEGSIQNTPYTLLFSRLEQHQTELLAYIDSQNPNPTLGDVIGTKRIVERDQGPLPAALPYKVVATTGGFAEVPDSLRHKFNFRLGSVDPFFGLPGPDAFNVTMSTPELAGKQVAVSFRPATQADADIIASYFPSGGADPSDPASWPTAVPGHLINLVGEFTVDGVVVASGGSYNLGEEASSSMGLWSPDRGWDTADNKPIAGEYMAVGLDLQGVAGSQLERVRTTMEAVRDGVAAGDISGFNRHDVTGALMQAGILQYFAINDLEDEITARSTDIVQYRYPSFGLMTTSVQAAYDFAGRPVSVEFPGVGLDVDLVRNIVVNKTNDTGEFINFNQMTGYRASAMEHAVPEQMFQSFNGGGEGVSAVKALAVAAQAGQKIFQITSANLASVLPQLSLDADVRADIVNSVNAGKVVTASQGNVNINGWVGTGYIVLDPDTGAGGYLISGGAAGGAMLLLLGILFILVGILLLLLGVTAIIGAMLISIGIHLILFSFLVGFEGTDWVLILDSFFTGVGLAATIIGLFPAFAAFSFALGIASLIAGIWGLLRLLGIVGMYLPWLREEVDEMAQLALEFLDPATRGTAEPVPMAG